MFDMVLRCKVYLAKGIHYKRSCVQKPQQNDIVKRKINISSRQLKLYVSGLNYVLLFLGWSYSVCYVSHSPNVSSSPTITFNDPSPKFVSLKNTINVPSSFLSSLSPTSRRISRTHKPPSYLQNYIYNFMNSANGHKYSFVPLPMGKNHDVDSTLFCKLKKNSYTVLNKHLDNGLLMYVLEYMILIPKS